MDMFNSALKNPHPPARRKTERKDDDSPQDPSDSPEARPPDPLDDRRRKKNLRRKHRNSHLGCGICKKRRIKCDENLPQCLNCVKGKLHCAYLNLDAPARNALRMAQYNQNLRDDRLDKVAKAKDLLPSPNLRPPDQPYPPTHSLAPSLPSHASGPVYGPVVYPVPGPLAYGLPVPLVQAQHAMGLPLHMLHQHPQGISPLPPSLPPQHHMVQMSQSSPPLPSAGHDQLSGPPPQRHLLAPLVEQPLPGPHGPRMGQMPQVPQGQMVMIYTDQGPIPMIPQNINGQYVLRAKSPDDPHMLYDASPAGQAVMPMVPQTPSFHEQDVPAQGPMPVMGATSPRGQVDSESPADVRLAPIRKREELDEELSRSPEDDKVPSIRMLLS